MKAKLTKEEQAYLNGMKQLIKQHDLRIKDAKFNEQMARDFMVALSTIAEINKDNVELFSDKLNKIIFEYNKWRKTHGMRRLRYRNSHKLSVAISDHGVEWSNYYISK